MPLSFKRLLVVVLLSTISTLTWSHPFDELLGPTLALNKWVDAVNRMDADAVKTMTTEGALPFTGSPNTTLSAGYATFSDDKEAVVAAPVIISTDLGSFLNALYVRLVNQENEWKISQVQFGAQLPTVLHPDHLPEHFDTVPVIFNISDQQTGKGVYTRLNIKDSQGEYWPPAGHQKNIRQGWRQDVGGDVFVDRETYAYVGPEFTAHLAPGQYTVTVNRGMEYTPRVVQVEVSANEDNKVSVAIERWVDMNKRGWYSGDTHTHFLSEKNAQLELRGEDLNVLYVLATKWGELITDVEKFTGAPLPNQPRGEVVVYNQETRHNFFGHTIMHGMEKMVHPITWGAPPEGVIGGDDHPTMASLADQAHANGGLVTWAHFPFPSGELTTDVALDKIDTVDLMTWGDIYSFPQPRTTTDWWYAYLNTGSRLPATAGTDKMLNTQVSGSVRTYAQVDGRFTYAKWLASLEAGRTFVTTGPMIEFTVNGAAPGAELKLKPRETFSVELSVDGPQDIYPIDSIEVVVGGQVVAAKEWQEGERLELNAEIATDESSWIAARVKSTHVLPYQRWQLLNATGVPVMAHTSPIYLIVDDQPIWDEKTAAALVEDIDRGIGWIKTNGSYRNEADRENAIALFERAKQHYREGPEK